MSCGSMVLSARSLKLFLILRIFRIGFINKYKKNAIKKTLVTVTRKCSKKSFSMGALLITSQEISYCYLSSYSIILYIWYIWYIYDVYIYICIYIYVTRNIYVYIIYIIYIHKLYYTSIESLHWKVHTILGWHCFYNSDEWKEYV